MRDHIGNDRYFRDRMREIGDRYIMTNHTIFTVNKGDTTRITYTHSIIKKAIRKELVCRYGRRDIKEYEEGLFPASKLPDLVLKKAKNILKANPTVYIYMRSCTFSVEKERKPEDIEISFCLLGSYNRKDIFGEDLKKEWLTFAKDFPYVVEGEIVTIVSESGCTFSKRIKVNSDHMR